MSSRFLAIDFETANSQSDSACSIGLVRVEDHKIVHKEIHLIRPPSRHFMFTYIHGLRWNDVADAPTFGELWPKIAPLFEGVENLAAHNASFDRRVLQACCARYEIETPETPFVCSMWLARQTWGIFPTKLPNVCEHLGITLNHHEALSDAEACARILIAAGTGQGTAVGIPE